MSMNNLAFSTAFHLGFRCVFTFSLFQIIQTDCIRRIGHWNSFLGYPQSFHRVTAIPLIKVPRVRIDLATLCSKWVQGVRQYGFADV